MRFHAADAVLGNPTNVRRAGRMGWCRQQAEADRFASNMMPMIQTFSRHRPEPGFDHGGTQPPRHSDRARRRMASIFSPRQCQDRANLYKRAEVWWLEIEAPSCHLAGVISRQTRSANIRPRGVDCTCSRDAYVSHKRCAAITDASHASSAPIDIRGGNSIEIGIAFQ
jgi:hypothetical protein